MRKLVIILMILNIIQCKKKETIEPDSNQEKNNSSLFVFANGGLNLRSGSDISSKKIGFINDGEFVKLLSKDKKDSVNNVTGYWYKIQYKDNIGFAFSHYLFENVSLNEEKSSPSKKYSYKLFIQEYESCELSSIGCFTILFRNNKYIKSFNGVIKDWIYDDKFTFILQGGSDDQQYTTIKSYDIEKAEFKLISFSRTINYGWYGGKNKVNEKFISGQILCDENICYIFLEDKQEKILLYDSLLNPKEYKDQYHDLLSKPELFIGSKISDNISRQNIYFSLGDPSIRFFKEKDSTRFIYLKNNDQSKFVEIFNLIMEKK